MAPAIPGDVLPSARWTSYDGWDYNGMQARLVRFMSGIDKSALVQHAQALVGQPVSISDTFSAGQFWCCFELLAVDGSLMIARVRLPTHPYLTKIANERSDLYSMQCEVATMMFLHENVKGISFPKIYACEGPGSEMAASVGAAYMLIEGFYGNNLQDMGCNICGLPVATQEHIIAQWASVKAELATITFPQIGSISHFSKDAGAVIGKLSTGVTDGLSNDGPFTEAWDYFASVAEAKFRRARENDFGDGNVFSTLGLFVFKDIVHNTALFKTSEGPFHFNHMDMGTQNILMDQNFNFVAIIDWEYAQVVPWEVNHYPSPFPLITSDLKTLEILRDPSNVAHRSVSRQVLAQGLYRHMFREAERELEERGKPLLRSIADVLDGPASRIFAIAGKIGIFDDMEEDLTYEMVRLAYGFEREEATKYLSRMEAKMRAG